MYSAHARAPGTGCVSRKRRPLSMPSMRSATASWRTRSGTGCARTPDAVDEADEVDVADEADVAAQTDTPAEESSVDVSSVLVRRPGT